MTQTSSVKATELLSSLRRATSEVVRQLRIPTHEFAYRVGWAPNYDALFRSEFWEESDITRLVERAFETGRVLLSSRGGGGKTVILSRLARECLNTGILPVRVDLKKWTAPDYNAWRELGDSPAKRAAFLLERFASPKVSTL